VPQTTAAAERCRVHRFTPDMTGLAIARTVVCVDGHEHQIHDRRMFFCARPACDFTMSVPMDLAWGDPVDG
jgi:hypothetical protein